ncbi:MAG: alanine racemase [bacterium]|nr:alanine racemase [bacterium]
MRLPYLSIDTAKVEANIKKMVSKAVQNGLEFRPHFKTHQSKQVGQLFKEHGVKGITVSSVYMADYFSSHGWDDITIAFPASVLFAPLYNELLQNCSLTLLLTDSEVAKKLDSKLNSPLSVYIEIDPGYGRSGIAFDDFNAIKELKSTIESCKNLTYEGFYTHCGHTYKCRSKDAVKSLVEPILTSLGNSKQTFGGKICFGDTPSCSILQHFDGIDQISPGNFVFYDWMQFNIGSCNPEEIAVSMHCEVVAKYEQRNEVLIHGGAVHFSKDFILNNNNEPNYGVLVDDCKSNSPSYIKSLSQEHGIVSCSKSTIEQISVGDVLEFYPIHSCLTANLMREYVTKAGEVISQFGSGAPYQLY